MMVIAMLLIEDYGNQAYHKAIELLGHAVHDGNYRQMDYYAEGARQLKHWGYDKFPKENNA